MSYPPVPPLSDPSNFMPPNKTKALAEARYLWLEEVLNLIIDYAENEQLGFASRDPLYEMHAEICQQVSIPGGKVNNTNQRNIKMIDNTQQVIVIIKRWLLNVWISTIDRTSPPIKSKKGSGRFTYDMQLLLNAFPEL